MRTAYKASHRRPQIKRKYGYITHVSEDIMNRIKTEAIRKKVCKPETTTSSVHACRRAHRSDTAIKRGAIPIPVHQHLFFMQRFTPLHAYCMKYAAYKSFNNFVESVKRWKQTGLYQDLHTIFSDRRASRSRPCPMSGL